MSKHLSEVVGSAVRVSLAEAGADHIEPAEVGSKSCG